MLSSVKNSMDLSIRGSVTLFGEAVTSVKHYGAVTVTLEEIPSKTCNDRPQSQFLILNHLVNMQGDFQTFKLQC